MAKIYFEQDFLEFFKELAANNHKEWFDENRKRYEKTVKKPFGEFVKDLIDSIAAVDPLIQIQPKDAIFRINRDIRFSPDKSPYKLNVSAIISPRGRKDHSDPGLYIDFGPEKVMVGGGAYFIPSDKLAALRKYIAHNLERFKTVTEDPVFLKHYKEIKGEEHKRLPKELKEASESQPLLFKKQLYYMAELPPGTVLKGTLLDTIMDYYRASIPVKEFLKEGLS